MRGDSRGWLLAPFALLLSAGGSGCSAKKSAAQTDAGDASSASAYDAATPAVLVHPGCHVASVGGNALEVPPGVLSLAVAKGKALLVSSGKTGADRVQLDATGAAVGASEPVHDALPNGAGVATLAVAIPFDGNLTTLTYASRHPSAAECADGTAASRVLGSAEPNRVLATHACRAATMLRGAARGAHGIALLDGATATDGTANAGAKSPPAVVDALLVAGAESRARTVRLEKIEGAAIDGAAVAAGTSSVAAAYVVVRGAIRELHVARLGDEPAAAPKIEVVDKQNVGTVSVAFDGETLYVVWSAFLADKNRYVIHWSKWPAGGVPSSPQALGTGVLSATGPSLAIDHGRFFLAWSEGDEKATIVKAAAARSGIAALPGLAHVVSTTNASAREPVVALENDAMFLAWKESDAPGTEPRVRASTVRCRE